jgi:hypothetical protein
VTRHDGVELLWDTAAAQWSNSGTSHAQVVVSTIELTKTAAAVCTVTNCSVRCAERAVFLYPVSANNC